MVRVGILADDLLKMKGRGEKFYVKEPRQVGKDDEGLVVEWYYRDGTAELRRKLGKYRVTKWKSSS